MNIRNKTPEELTNQAEWYLEFLEVDENIKEDLIESLSLDKSDKKNFSEGYRVSYNVEKGVTRHVIVPWDKYETYLKVVKLFEPYKTESDRFNKGLLKFMINRYSSKGLMERLKTFMSSTFYAEFYKTWKMQDGKHLFPTSGIAKPRDFSPIITILSSRIFK